LRAALRKAVQTVRRIEDRASQSIDDVKIKEKIWLDSVRPALRPFRSVANLWTACFFGNDLPQRDYEALLELLDIDPEKIRPWKTGAEFQEIVLGAVQKGTVELAGREFDKNQLKNLCAFLIRAEKTAYERRFFNWELEFPEIFFNDDGSPRESSGFDVVIGNPPWIGHEISELQPHIGASCFSLFDKIDTYLAFFDKAVTVVRRNGNVGFITPNTYFNNRTALRFRQRLITSRMLRRIVDLPKRTFKDAPDVYPCITILGNGSEPNGTYAVGKGTINNIPSHFTSIAYDDLMPPNYYITAQHSSTALDSILRKIEVSQPTLSQFAAFQKGVETGNDAIHLKQLKSRNLAGYRGCMAVKSDLMKLIAKAGMFITARI
jgi:Eco57I restriction-modification methylase